MARSEYLAIIVIAIMMTISFQQAFALKCWTCSSDSVKAKEFCNDPFDDGKINEIDRSLSYKECVSIPNHTVYCRKLQQIVKNVTVISRSCYLKPANAPKDQCYDTDPPVSFVRNEHCEICEKDGCNTAVQYGPIAVLVAIPMAVAKVLLF